MENAGIGPEVVLQPSFNFRDIGEGDPLLELVQTALKGSFFRRIKKIRFIAVEGEIKPSSVQSLGCHLNDHGGLGDGRVGKVDTRMATHDEMNSRHGLSKLHILWIAKMAEKDDQIGFGLELFDHGLSGFRGGTKQESFFSGIVWVWKSIGREEAEDPDSQTIDFFYQRGMEERFARGLIDDIGREEGEVCFPGHLQ